MLFMDSRLTYGMASLQVLDRAGRHHVLARRREPAAMDPGGLRAACEVHVPRSADQTCATLPMKYGRSRCFQKFERFLTETH